ncbi:MAG: hypothetical protein AAGM46_27830 [Cyanobacteria bacterium J06582_2]
MIKKCFSDKTITIDEFRTLLCETENFVNSRPLLYCADSDEVLTPAKLLYGREIITSPLLVDHLDDISHSHETDLRLQYRILSKLRAEFIKIFQADYLVSLKTRHYCEFQGTYNDTLETGELVFANLGLPKNPRVNWPLSKVVSVRLDNHNLPREVDVLHGGKIYTRPIDRIIKLELSASKPTPPVPVPSPRLGTPIQPALRAVPRRKAAVKCDKQRLDLLQSKQL